MLQVDSAYGKKNLRLTNVLLIESMQINILSLQKLRAAGFVYPFIEVPGKAVIKKHLPGGQLEQVAFMTESKAWRLTLDCTIISLLSSLPSCRQVEVLSNSLSMDLLHRRLGHNRSASALERKHGHTTWSGL